MGNYDDLAIQIVNRYMKNRYNLTTEELDYYIKNILINYNNIKETIIDGISFQFYDSIISRTVDLVSAEINAGREYDFKNFDFKKGDCVIDIGGNIGMVSIYLAKKYPFLKIYAFEPVHQNYKNFKANIELNKIPSGTIILENKAVTKDARIVNMSINALNTGGSSISDVVSVGAITQDINCNIKSTTLEKIIKQRKIKTLKLLKIDCEGSEYEILYNTPKNILQNIQSLRGEFHENKNLTDNYDIDKLYAYIQQYINDIKIVAARSCFIM